MVTLNGVRLFPPFLHLHQSFNAHKGPSAPTPQVLPLRAGWCFSFMRHRFPPSEAAISDMVRNEWMNECNKFLQNSVGFLSDLSLRDSWISIKTYLCRCDYFSHKLPFENGENGAVKSPLNLPDCCINVNLEPHLTFAVPIVHNHRAIKIKFLFIFCTMTKI